MVSLKDIASDVGVSIPLVSKVLNNRLGSTGASKDTIARIKSSARRLGYRKNQAAAALRTGRQNVIGVFLHWIGEDGSGIIESILKGIAAGCHKHGVRQQIAFIENIDDLEKLTPMATLGEMDGLIVAGAIDSMACEAIQSIASSGLPLISAFGQDHENSRIPNVGSNEVELNATAITHLRDAGCKKILILGPSCFRHNALPAACEKLNLTDEDYRYVAADSFNYNDGVKLISEMLADGNFAFDGVYAFSDQLALAAIHTLMRNGRNVPKDVKVVGVDNSPYCEFSMIPLTSVSGEDYERGLKAVDLICRLRDGGAIESTYIAPRLHARRSTATE